MKKIGVFFLTLLIVSCSSADSESKMIELINKVELLEIEINSCKEDNKKLWRKIDYLEDVNKEILTAIRKSTNNIENKDINTTIENVQNETIKSNLLENLFQTHEIIENSYNQKFIFDDNILNIYYSVIDNDEKKYVSKYRYVSERNTWKFIGLEEINKIPEIESNPKIFEKNIIINDFKNFGNFYYTEQLNYSDGVYSFITNETPIGYLMFHNVTREEEEEIREQLKIYIGKYSFEENALKYFTVIDENKYSENFELSPRGIFNLKSNKNNYIMVLLASRPSISGGEYSFRIYNRNDLNMVFKSDDNFKWFEEIIKPTIGDFNRDGNDDIIFFSTAMDEFLNFSYWSFME